MKTKAITLILALLTICCQKPAKNRLKTSIEAQIPPLCTNWQGQWRCVDADSLLPDSIIITYKGTFSCVGEGLPVGPQGQTHITRYTSNHPFLDSVLWHYCPYKNPYDDDIHLTCAGKTYILRYDH